MGREAIPGTVETEEDGAMGSGESEEGRHGWVVSWTVNLDDDESGGEPVVVGDDTPMRRRLTPTAPMQIAAGA